MSLSQLILFESLQGDTFIELSDRGSTLILQTGLLLVTIPAETRSALHDVPAIAQQ